MITRYKAADPSDPTSKAEYKVLAAGAQRYWHGTRAAFEQVKDSIPNNTMICITDDNDAPSDIAPVGSVFDYEGNTAPDGYLFCDGSTFDTSLYPDLYLFLGSDTLPDKGSGYDLSHPESITTAQLYAGYTAQHSGWLMFSGFASIVDEYTHAIKINGVAVASLPYETSTGYARPGFLQIPVKKGDVLKVTYQLGSDFFICFIAPYAKPKLIKATSNMTKSDASALLDQMAQHIRNQNILSDYEDITISTDSANPTVMRYDGFIYLSTRFSVDLYINTKPFLISDHDGVAGGGACMLAVRKGDRVYMTRSRADTITGRVAYYKLRDYTGR